MSTRKKKPEVATSKADTNGVGEVQIQKSPAEFFAENQAIAGFDNMGKSLYTTVRELIENGLDACEMVRQLPTISVHIQEYTQKEFNKLTTNDLRLDLSSISNSVKDIYLSPDRKEHEQKDTKLYEKRGKRNSTQNTEIPDDGDVATDINAEAGSCTGKDANDSTTKKAKKTTTDSSQKQNQYYLITVVDNGCGMEHNAIPDMFGRVLSGSKYGVRQTRGKFGLGAKMALIWSKKSSGHPIHVLTAHNPNQEPTVTASSAENSRRKSPSHVSSCILDIDIYRNQPNVVEHKKILNKSEFVGTVVRVLIAGNWTTYKSRIVQYIQQLAIITPYAEISMTYTEATGKRDVQLIYHRRSEQMPDKPSTVKHHPASVNNIIVQQLTQQTKAKNLVSFLTKELQAISVPLAKRLIAELEESAGLSEDFIPTDLSDKQITLLVQLFHQVQLFRPPDGTCLSPLGEYNLNLGIHKVLEPDFIATTRDKVSVYEGHPFLIEAAVSLGGANAKEGVTVYRFANRIPLLFEGGADVATRVALTKIKWSNYKIDYKRDKVGVFVSIVSTKIPFKGTSKEYIGDDATEIHQSVKRALQSCCQQLRAHLMKRNALKDAKTRRSKLVKYVPDISRSLFGLLDGMRQRRKEIDDHTQLRESPMKRLRLDPAMSNDIIKMLDKKQITEGAIHSLLLESIDLEPTNTLDSTNVNDNQLDAATRAELEAASVPPVPLYIVPLYNLDDPTYDVCHPLFTFRPIVPLKNSGYDGDDT